MLPAAVQAATPGEYLADQMAAWIVPPFILIALILVFVIGYKKIAVGFGIFIAVVLVAGFITQPEIIVDLGTNLTDMIDTASNQ